MKLSQADSGIAMFALVAMMMIPLVEISLRPSIGHGVQNAAVLVQHLGLVMAMFGAVAAERNGHLATFGGGVSRTGPLATRIQQGAHVATGLVCGALALASWHFVDSERQAAHLHLAYGMPTWWIQASLPVGFGLLGMRVSARVGNGVGAKLCWSLLVPALGAFMGSHMGSHMAGAHWPWWSLALVLLAMLLMGSPVFAVLGALALGLCWQGDLPIASVALSHYQITVNPSLPSLPLFTLAGLVFANTGAARRLGLVFTTLCGNGAIGTVIAAAVLCSCFTALTGGSGVTILALGGLLMPLLVNAGFPEKKSVSLITSASALGVLLAPSVPLIMYAVIARVPVNTMLLAGVLPAILMVVILLLVGGYVSGASFSARPLQTASNTDRQTLQQTLWSAKWELLTPVVAIGSLASGLATQVESAALTAMYALLTQSMAHRELDTAVLLKCLRDASQIIGGVMLILGMALGITNSLVDAGIPDAATEWVQQVIPNRIGFLIALNLFLLAAGALMEIFAAIVVLVPLLLPVAVSYGIDPVHFGIIFLANLEMGFLCPPAGMNLFFASAMFNKPIREVAWSVLPALGAIFLGTLVISLLPDVATALPRWLLGTTTG